MCSRERNHPKLSIANSKKHADYERELMMCEIKQVIKEKLEESKGIPFGQCDHDGVNNAKGTKLKSF